ncbi:hypothetical protein L3X38_042056 [Prunus dulcis]|uniref:Uncharacterized protein n=1 Tax=Prunus dulcis TaxID=3755 RepID=A0AAD4UVU5_PRUDU|nr:hypothetical protein L3X38_042056 [Prunus dulcis]
MKLKHSEKTKSRENFDSLTLSPIEGQGIKGAMFGCGHQIPAKSRRQSSKRPSQNADTSGDCEKNEDEDDFSFACTNSDESSISTDDVFQNGQIHQVFPIFNRDLLFANADDGNSSKARARGVAASSSSQQPPLNKLFFESGYTDLGNVVLQLRRWTQVLIHEIN